MKSVPDRRFRQLVSCVLDDRLTSEQEAELLSLLEDPAREKLFAEWTRLDREIAGLFGAHPGREDGRFGPRRHQPTGHRQPSKGSLASASPCQPWWSAATAACLLIAVGLWYLVSSQSADLSIARLAEVHGDVYIVDAQGRTPVQADQSLFAGQGLQTEGEESSATIIYPDGTRLELAADTLVTQLLEDASAQAGRSHGKRVLLAEGFLTADVVRQPAQEPMILVTPHAEITVVGTKFNLSGGSEVTYVETSEGAVRVKRKTDGESVKVDAGFGTAISNRIAPLTPQSSPTTFQPPRLNLEPCWTGALSPDGKTLAATRYLGGEVQLWNVESGQQRSLLHAHSKRVVAAVFSPDGRTLATGGLDEVVHLWDVQSGQFQATLDRELGGIVDLAFSADGKALTVLSSSALDDRRTLTQWDLKTHEPRWPALELSAYRWSLSPNGKLLATASRPDRVVTIWDLEAGQRRRRLSDVPRTVFGMAFSHDGATLALDGSIGLVELRDVSTGRVRTSLQRHGGAIQGMTFSHDDKILATGHQTGTIRLWDLETANQLAVLESGAGPARARALAFTPDGTALLTGEIRLATSQRERSGAVQLWDLNERNQRTD